MELIKKLEATKTATLKYYDLRGVPLQRSYASGKWTIRYLLHHLADAETVLFELIRRIINEPRRVSGERRGRLI